MYSDLLSFTVLVFVDKGEVMLLLSERDIKSVFTMKDAIEADKEAFKLVVKNEVEIPLRTKISVDEHDGCLLFMPAYSSKIQMASLKNVNIFPNNESLGITTAPAQVLLIDGKTGVIIAMLDGAYVTRLRTGAASGAAFDVLAKKNCEVGALIGTGSQAKEQLEAMLVARKLREVRVCARNYERTSSFVNSLKEEFSNYGADIKAVRTSDEAIDDADLIITVTSSNEPVFDGYKVKKGATISAVGAYQHHMQELHPAALTRASKIYFDSEEAVLSESGDILKPLEEKIISKSDFTGDLGDVLLGNIVGRENDEEIIVFETVGVGAQDLMAANEIYKKAIENNIGTIWN